MAIGDGITWDEAKPDDDTLATKIDDYDKDLRKGIRSRLAQEHEFPSSQAGTSEGGKHKFMTLQMQNAAPTLAGTQVGAVYQRTVAAIGDALFFENAANQEVNASDRIYFWFVAGNVSVEANASATFPLISAGTVKRVRGVLKTTASGGDGVQVDINYNGNSLWTSTADQLILAPGATSTNVTSFATSALTAGGLLTIDLDKIGSGTAGSDLTVLVEVG